MSFNACRSIRPIEWLLAILLLLAPLYFHPNIGGTGLRIPNNILIWAVASIIGFYSLYKFSQSKIIILPRYILLLISFPLLTFFSSFFSGVELAQQWTFRNLYIWGGVVFLFALFQAQLKGGRIDRLLFVIVLSGLVHALVGIIQILCLKQLPIYFPINASGIPTGLFQQINNQASFQTTAIIIALWLSSRPFIAKGSSWLFITLLLAVACATFVVTYSGSRVGVLGFIIAFPLMLLSRWHFLKRDCKRLGLMAFVFIMSIGLASSIESNRGLTSALEKSTAVNAGFSGSARLGMYAIAFDVIHDAPLFGHGIGSFVRVWQLGKPAFYAENPDAKLPAKRVAHPHNETIFWLVEGGAVTVAGLLLIFIATLLSLKQLPPSRLYAYAALLFPITLHTQVELPFYISAEHWFVFLILLFVIFQPKRYVKTLILSNSARNLIKIIAISSGTLSLLFLSHTMAANLEFKRHIMKNTPIGEEPFSIAMQNPYFKTLATNTMMSSLFHSSIKYGLKDNVRLFAEWGKNEIRHNPHFLFYRLTTQAFLFLGESDRACSIAKEGQSIYPADMTIKKLIGSCEGIS